MATTLERRFSATTKLAARFPGVEVSTSYGTPAIKVKGKFMARLRSEAEGWLAIRCDFLARDMLLEAEPDVFHLTDHYRDYPMILVDLAKIEKSALLAILEQAWRMTASQKLIREYDGKDPGERHAETVSRRAPGSHESVKPQPGAWRCLCTLTSRESSLVICRPWTTKPPGSSKASTSPDPRLSRSFVRARAM